MNEPARTTSSLAIASLVSGVLGWTLLPLIGCLVAVVTGHMARAEIRRASGLEGDGLAVAGLVLGWLGIGMAVAAVLMVVAAIVFFGGLAWLSEMH
ncbi:DUF4190 domain-containing protein [Cognatilysobacter bugurensis]|uniref:Membrane protein n=1 Tax=Cognatilysobacter bugurensis TaxID=543356 RepID=A0A918STV2_9GAMM|nr:DUF4190 domain-containing protein [Lysobacter bugurensis]GHA70141.1 membrane protein [Lysobacter bugurensis]